MLCGKGFPASNRCNGQIVYSGMLDGTLECKVGEGVNFMFQRSVVSFPIT